MKRSEIPDGGKKTGPWEYPLDWTADDHHLHCHYHCHRYDRSHFRYCLRFLQTQQATLSARQDKARCCYHR